MKICMPPRGCLMSWPGSCMLPRRCPPSWLGWQLHVNIGGYLVGAGLAVAPLTPLAMVLPGGPTRILLWRTIVPDKDLAGGLVGFLGKDLAGGLVALLGKGLTEGRRLLVLI